MNEVYSVLAENYEKLAAGFRALANETPVPTKLEPEAVSEPAAEPDVPALTIEDVRAALQEKMKDHRKEVQALLLKYDSGKLSGVKPEDYAALVADARLL